MIYIYIRCLRSRNTHLYIDVLLYIQSERDKRSSPDRRRRRTRRLYSRMTAAVASSPRIPMYIILYTYDAIAKRKIGMRSDYKNKTKKKVGKKKNTFRPVATPNRRLYYATTTTTTSVITKDENQRFIIIIFVSRNKPCTR